MRDAWVGDVFACADRSGHLSPAEPSLGTSTDALRYGSAVRYNNGNAVIDDIPLDGG